MEMRKVIGAGPVVLVKFKSVDYRKKVRLLLGALDEAKQRVCYITINKTVGFLLEELKKENLNPKDIIFIDAISRTINVEEPEKRIYYLDSPSELDKLTVIISNILELEKCTYFVLDNLSTMLVYSNEKLIIKFLHKYVGMIRAAHKQSIIMVLAADSQRETLKEIEMFVDKSISL